MQLTTIAPPVVPSACGCVALDGQVVPNPAIAAVSPNEWAVAGGTPVTITGGAFTGATAVQAFNEIGGAPVAVPFVVTNDGLITVAASPALPAGEYDLVVTTPGGRSSIKFTVA